MTFREKLRAGKPTYGVSLYGGTCMAVELLGQWGFDYAFIDTEHVGTGVEAGLEKQIMSARLAGIASLVRLSGAAPREIGKTLDFGADGVVIPQVKTAEEMRLAVAAAKFPPMGRRGGEAAVRSAGFGGRGFSWPDYIERANTASLVVPIAENVEFFDNIDAILSVPGVDIVAFGPNDFALSRGLTSGTAETNRLLEAALDRLIDRSRAHGVAVMNLCMPPTRERATDLFTRGVNCLTVGTDAFFLNRAFEGVSEEIGLLVQPQR